MKNISPILIYVLTLSFTSCNFSNEKVNSQVDRQWVYIELITESKTDTSEYFYYAQIKKSLIDGIESNEEKNRLRDHQGRKASDDRCLIFS